MDAPVTQADWQIVTKMKLLLIGLVLLSGCGKSSADMRIESLERTIEIQDKEIQEDIRQMQKDFANISNQKRQMESKENCYYVREYYDVDLLGVLVCCDKKTPSILTLDDYGWTCKQSHRATVKITAGGGGAGNAYVDEFGCLPGTSRFSHAGKGIKRIRCDQ